VEQNLTVERTRIVSFDSSRDTKQFQLHDLEAAFVAKAELKRGTSLAWQIAVRSRHEEDFPGVWISHSRSRRKGADVNIISFGRIRARDHPFMAWHRNPIRHIAFCFLYWNG
jgi:hypothetical protein